MKTIKKSLLLLTLYISANAHALSYVRNIFFVRPSKAAINLHLALQKTYPNASITQNQANNLLNNTYNTAQFQNTTYDQTKSISLEKDSQQITISRKDIDRMINNAKYSSPFIPHWATNTVIGFSSGATMLYPMMMASALAGGFAMDDPKMSATKVLIVGSLVTLGTCAVVGSISAAISNLAVKFVARKVDCKV